MITVDVICGGQSGEHDVSTVSASAIANGLIKQNDKYRVYGVYITKDGQWFRSSMPFDERVAPESFKSMVSDSLWVTPSVNPRKKTYFNDKGVAGALPDIMFPVLHGTKGEDGVIQGLFELMNIPYVGSGVGGGMCGMDKDIMRTLFKAEGLPLLPWLSFEREYWEENEKEMIHQIQDRIPFPLFVKPANLGSSVGISKVLNPEELKESMQLAFRYDNKVVVEEGRSVREIECSVLGNQNCRASVPGEIIPGADFYDYEDKYHGNKASLAIPAPISEILKSTLQSYAIRAFKSVQAQGLSRVDFFICKNTGEVYVNEINTFPGFTQISMYPKLWEASGISFNDLLSQLINLGFERYKRNSRLSV